MDSFSFMQGNRVEQEPFVSNNNDMDTFTRLKTPNEVPKVTCFVSVAIVK